MKKIVSVGYRVIITPTQWKEISKCDLKMNEQIYGEVMYATKDDIGEQLGGSKVKHVSQRELADWYAKKLAGTDRIGYLTYILMNKKIILGYVTCNQEKFPVVLANTTRNCDTYAIHTQMMNNTNCYGFEIDKMPVELVAYKIEKELKGYKI
jgi:hypothetical protein